MQPERAVAVRHVYASFLPVSPLHGSLLSRAPRVALRLFNNDFASDCAPHPIVALSVLFGHCCQTVRVGGVGRAISQRKQHALLRPRWWGRCSPADLPGLGCGYCVYTWSLRGTRAIQLAMLQPCAAFWRVSQADLRPLEIGPANVWMIPGSMLWAGLHIQSFPSPAAKDGTLTQTTNPT